ncbi:MAG: copper-binding protein [Acidovorax sp.]
MKTIKFIAASALLASAGAVFSQNHTHHAEPAQASAESAENAQGLSEGEITRWDARTGKITLRHGELTNLDMPAMTMVFTLQAPAQIGDLKVGDKVRFRAEQVNGALAVTHIEAAQPQEP